MLPPDRCSFGLLTPRTQERTKECRETKVVVNDGSHEDSNDEYEQKRSGADKQMWKMKNKNKSRQYDDSDEDKNPYANSVCYRSTFPFFGGTYLCVNRSLLYRLRT